ncbi:MAG: class I SAM-dependent methyltransferase [Parvularculaceae bacterium]
MKDASSVGSDFDVYAKHWKSSEMGLEVGGDAEGIKTVDSEEVKRAGDEWGAQQQLLAIYKPLFEKYIPNGDANFLEIGPGGGRFRMRHQPSRRAPERLSGDRRLREYVKVAQERVGDRVHFNIIDKVDLSALPADHFDFCLAQSSWSHINLYDQLRYLRELRRIMKVGAPVTVIGQFIVGLGDDWTWNRIRNRIEKQESGRRGIFHEVIGVSMLAEFLTRFGYDRHHLPERLRRPQWRAGSRQADDIGADQFSLRAEPVRPLHGRAGNLHAAREPEIASQR